MSPHPEPQARPLGPFVGRDDELARVLDWIARGERLIVVIGPPGVGKRRFAREVIARAAPPPRLLDTAGAPASGLDAEALVAELERHPALCILIAATSPLGRPEERILALDGLAEADAIGLFEAHLARAGTPLSPADRAALPGLVAALDGLPLAIETAARRADVLPPARALAALSDWCRTASRDGSREPRPLERGGSALALFGPTLGARLATAWNALAPDERAALGALAAFERPFDLEAAHALLALPLPEAAARVEALVRASWLVAAGAAGISQRSLARAFVQDHALTPAPVAHALTLDAIERRLRAYREHGGDTLARTLAADHAALWLWPHRSLADALRLRALGAALAIAQRLALTTSDGELATAHALLAAATGAPLDALAEALLALVDVHLARAEHERASALLDRLAALLDTAPGDPTHAALRARLDLGRAALAFDAHGYDDAEALYRAALAQLDPEHAAGDHARALANLALCDVMRGRLDQALVALARAAAGFARAGERDLLPRLHANRAYVLIHLERWSDATAEIAAGLAWAVRLGRERDRAFLTAELGRVAWRQRHVAEAYARYHEAAAIAQGVGYHFIQAKALLMAAWLDLERGDHATLDELVPRIRDAALRSDDVALQASLEAFDALRRALVGRPPDPRALPLTPDATLVGRGLFGASALALRATLRALAAPGARAHESPPQPPAAPPAPGVELDDLRRIHDFALLVADARAGASDVLLVDAARDEIRPGAAPWLQLARRPVLKRLVFALIEARATAPGTPLTLEKLARAAWGDERMSPEARDNRLHVSLSKIRQSGLDGMLEHVGHGWRLTPEVRLLFAARAVIAGQRAD